MLPSSDDSATSSIASKRWIPPVERFASHYARYNGPIGKLGANPTTHTAEVRFLGKPGLGVVKAFALSDFGWVNEAIAWALGNCLGVVMPPQGMLLLVAPGELGSDKEPELMAAHNLWGTGAIVLWCTSRLDIKCPQNVWPIHWERVVMSKPYGRRLAAFDAWLGNCDRIAQNAPYWSSKGLVAAIDHERLAFAQDWRKGVPIHMDRLDAHQTHLMKVIREMIAAKKLRAAEANELVAELAVMSEPHADTLSLVHADATSLVGDNFGTAAAANLLKFLSDRATPAFINERLEQLR
ncbi:hypothetical protein [Paucibacter sp. DJ1R-11]|uniref:hypothetical protein n=1 Tax=Paucibacter sp. DJ1R-11 TaxID=2893556 RepID=UPI0021E3EAE0|nr:hypothetical protein [Paucibacter sp. DJ1R-11]